MAEEARVETIRNVLMHTFTERFGWTVSDSGDIEWDDVDDLARAVDSALDPTPPTPEGEQSRVCGFRASGRECRQTAGHRGVHRLEPASSAPDQGERDGLAERLDLLSMPQAATYEIEGQAFVPEARLAEAIRIARSALRASTEGAREAREELDAKGGVGQPAFMNAECVQVAAMAQRVAEDGNDDFGFRPAPEAAPPEDKRARPRLGVAGLAARLDELAWLSAGRANEHDFGTASHRVHGGRAAAYAHAAALARASDPADNESHTQPEGSTDG